MISYYLHKFGGWLMFVVVVIIFLIGLQVVQRAKQGLGLAPAPAQQSTANPQPGTAPPSGSPTAQAPTTTNPTPVPVVPAGPTAAEIRARLQEARDQLVESGVHVDNALKSISNWQAEIPQLLSTSAGDKIAQHEDLVANLTNIVKTERMPETKLQNVAKRVATFRTELGKRATSSTPKPLTADEEKEIDELHTTVSAADEEWNAALSNARAIRLLADARVEPEKKRTLKEEIEVKAAEEKLAQFAEQQREEKERKEQEAKDQLEQERLAAEREREKEQLAATRKEEAEAAAEKKRLEEETLLARARSTEVQSTLAPFQHKRDVQPQKVGGGSVKFEPTFESQPMSLSALSGMGALEESTEGLKWLARVGGHRKLSGPRWGIASQPNNWTDDDKKLLQEAQQLLRELGPILVKDGSLSP
jgi:hypothetical protein